MSRNYTGPPLEYTEEINTLVRQAFIFQNVAQMPYTPMIDLVDQLLERNESSLNETFGKYVMLPNHTVTSVLEGLQDTLHRLPHDSITGRQESISAILLAIVIIVVLLRLYARKYVTPKKLRSEDYWSLATLIIVIGMTICTWVLNIKGKAGHHVWDISLWDYRGSQLWLFIGQMWFYPAHLALKVSFLVFYRRLFVSREYRIAIWSVGLFTLAITLIGIFGAIFQCKPVDFWNHFLTRKCIDLPKFYLIRSVFYSLTDFMILLLPVPGIWNLRIRLKEKFLLLGLFGLGIFVSIASVFRLMALWEWFTSMDFPYRVEIHNIWACVEIDLAIVVSCAPALKVILCHQNSPIASIPSAIAKGLSTKDGTYNSDGSTTTRSWRWSKLSWSYSTITKKSAAASVTANSSVWPAADENKDHEMVRVLVTKSVSAETVDAHKNKDLEKGVTVDVNVLRE